MKKIALLSAVALSAGFLSFSGCTYNTYDVVVPPAPTPRPVARPAVKAPPSGVSNTAEGFRAIERPASYSY